MSRFIKLIVAICLLATSAESLFAQGAVTKALPTKDNWLITVSYYPSTAGKESPVVVFLHGEKQHRKFWDVPGINWPAELQKQGVACISVDLRLHGDSKPPGMDEVDISSRDNQAMVALDMEAVKKFIYDEHQDEKLNMRKLCLVGSEMGSTIALQYTMLDWLKKPWPDAPTLAARTPRGQDVRALVLISPVERISGVSAGKAINSLRNPAFDIALLSMYGDKDPADDGDGHKIYEKFKRNDDDNDPRIYEVAFPTKARGFELINNNELAKKAFFTFIDRELKQSFGEWVNRRSPIDTSIPD